MEQRQHRSASTGAPSAVSRSHIPASVDVSTSTGRHQQDQEQQQQQLQEQRQQLQEQLQQLQQRQQNPRRQQQHHRFHPYESVDAAHHVHHQHGNALVQDTGMPPHYRQRHVQQDRFANTLHANVHGGARTTATTTASANDTTTTATANDATTTATANDATTTLLSAGSNGRPTLDDAMLLMGGRGDVDAVTVGSAGSHSTGSAIAAGTSPIDVHVRTAATASATDNFPPSGMPRPYAHSVVSAPTEIAWDVRSYLSGDGSSMRAASVMGGYAGYPATIDHYVHVQPRYAHPGGHTGGPALFARRPLMAGMPAAYTASYYGDRAYAVPIAPGYGYDYAYDGVGHVASAHSAAEEARAYQQMPPPILIPQHAPHPHAPHPSPTHPLSAALPLPVLHGIPQQQQRQYVVPFGGQRFSANLPYASHVPVATSTAPMHAPLPMAADTFSEAYSVNDFDMPATVDPVTVARVAEAAGEPLPNPIRSSIARPEPQPIATRRQPPARPPITRELLPAPAAPIVSGSVNGTSAPLPPIVIEEPIRRNASDASIPPPRSISSSGPSMRASKDFIDIYQDHTEENRTFTLVMRQQPDRARICGFGDKDRRPIDPPPIVELIVHDSKGVVVSNPSDLNMFVLHASLLAAEEDVQLSVIDADPCPMRSLMGSLVSNAYNVYDDERYNGKNYFVFSDLSVRLVGVYRLKFTLVNVLSVLKSPEGACPASATITSAPFRAYTAKKFPGMVESSELMRALAQQGARVVIRRENRVKSAATSTAPEARDQQSTMRTVVASPPNRYTTSSTSTAVALLGDSMAKDLASKRQSDDREQRESSNGSSSSSNAQEESVPPLSTESNGSTDRGSPPDDGDRSCDDAA